MLTARNVTPKSVSGRVVNTSNDWELFLTAKRTRRPLECPIQLRCRSTTVDGQLTLFSPVSSRYGVSSKTTMPCSAKILMQATDVHACFTWAYWVMPRNHWSSIRRSTTAPERHERPSASTCSRASTVLSTGSHCTAAARRYASPLEKSCRKSHCGVSREFYSAPESTCSSPAGTSKFPGPSQRKDQEPSAATSSLQCSF